MHPGCAIELRHYPVLAMGSKNAADIALVIAAMDLLHGGGIEGFAIVSSDTDFVRLATRIREAGLPVLGLGFGFGPTGERRSGSARPARAPYSPIT